MKEITLKVPEKKVSFFMELFSQLGLEISNEVDIPEKHKAIVAERIYKSTIEEGRLLEWADVQDKFKLD